MVKAWEFLVGLMSGDSGQDLIEYALICALVALSAVAAMGTLSTKIGSQFSSIGNAFSGAASGGSSGGSDSGSSGASQSGSSNGKGSGGSKSKGSKGSKG